MFFSLEKNTQKTTTTLARFCEKKEKKKKTTDHGFPKVYTFLKTTPNAEIISFTIV